MDAFKDTVAVLAALIGLVTTVLTMVAKYLDVKKSATPPSPAAPPPGGPSDWYAPPASSFARPPQDASTIARARDIVRGPAITMIVFGSLSLFFNLIVAGYGVIDNYVAPISDESKLKQANLAVIQHGDLKLPPGMVGSANDGEDKILVAATMFLLMSFALTSVVAIWGGIGMLRLKGYWVSVAGSFAIMAGASMLCCLTGFPVGAWSLWTLFRPEVSSAFR